MKSLIQKTKEELVRRNYAASTLRAYLQAIRHFQLHVGKPLTELGPDDIRSYHAYLLGKRKLAVSSVVVNICAIRFLYIKVLKRRDMKEDLPYPKERMRLPAILSPGEVAQLIGGARNLYHRTMLILLYATGLRRSEMCRLKVSDIDSKRMMLRVEHSVRGRRAKCLRREIPRGWPSAYLFFILEHMSRELLGNFELMVMLALIRLGEAAYGVPISKIIEESTNREVLVGSVYAALERLEAKGFVLSEVGEPTPERGGRAKRYFRITDNGLRQVRDTRGALVKLWKGIPALQGGTR